MNATNFIYLYNKINDNYDLSAPNSVAPYFVC